jgi:hypothetical protein
VAVTGWEPATEAEVALAAALKTNDQESYFRILSRLELFLPVSADSLAGRAPMGWGTWSTGGRTHVLAFTSPTAMRICLGESAASARQIQYAELAAAWPSAEWWLAVNPGLPIEGYLPAWFVAQLARGDSRLPGRESVPASAQPAWVDREGRSSTIERGSASPVGRASPPPASQQSPPAPPAGQRFPPVAARARATAAVPRPSPHVPEPPPPVSPIGTAAETVAAGRSPAAETAAAAPPPAYGTAAAAPAPAVTTPPATASSAVAAAAAASSAVASGAPAQGIAGAAPGWRGTNPASAGEGPAGLPRRSIPADTGTDQQDQDVQGGVARQDEGGSIATAVRQATVAPGRSDVLPQRPAEGVVRAAAVPTQPDSPAREPAAEPPDRRPRDGAAEADTSAASSGFTAANDVEANLLAAAGEGSTDSFLSTLLLATVTLPVAPDSAPGGQPGDPGFVWRTESLDGEPYLVVFTSPQRLAEHFGSAVAAVQVRFVQLIRQWPDPAWSFAVNPGTPLGAKLPGPEIVALANWAAEVGLGDDADGGEEQAREEVPATQTAPPAAPPERPRTTMQKVIAPEQVGFYLDRGYDRVSGFVHRAHEVAHLTTPARLYAALGLGYADSPFSPQVEEVYVLRWPVHRPALYRIPYGGQTEQAMRAMQGWVIERPPFRGNGFAPGESRDVVAEFKVDSVRLPHGAQLWRLGIEGTRRLIATLDADGPRWRPAEEG